MRNQLQIEIASDTTLKEANSQGAKVKSRMLVDMTASGLNSCYRPAPYEGHTTRVVADLKSFYHHWAVADPLSYACAVIVRGRLYRSLVVPFGFCLAPVFALAWSSEFKKIFEANGVKTAACMDDFLTAAATEAMARQLLTRMVAVAEDLGFTIQREKVDIGQALVFAECCLTSNKW